MNSRNKKNIGTPNPKIVINENMKDHGSDPFFVRMEKTVMLTH